MKMTSGQRALDKIYKRRDRYDIPDWQRGEVWDTKRKQMLVDSILRGWKLPKLYFLKIDDDSYEVVDGQQRLAAIYDFFGDELALSAESADEFGGSYYSELKTKISDTFDDFEIEYDQIDDATQEEMKLFFQRLQLGLPLTGSEKLNSVHGKLRDYCRSLSAHVFFKKSIAASDVRLAHFDILSKVAAIEVEGIDTGLRFEDIKKVFDGQKSFSATSAVAKRLRAACDFMAKCFPKREPLLKNRTVVQTVLTFACHLVVTGKAKGLESKVAGFIKNFLFELAKQVELGQGATDRDYIRFQKSISANVKGGAKTRDEIFLRKAFLYDSALADVFDPSVLTKSGIRGLIKDLSDEIAAHIDRINSIYSVAHGEDLFKATNKTAQAILKIGKPIADMSSYTKWISELYFLFRESLGQRLGQAIPKSFLDVNILRTSLQHDVDHGAAKDVKKKKIKIGNAFEIYSGQKSPDLLDPERFVIMQANLLSAIELDLKNLSIA